MKAIDELNYHRRELYDFSYIQSYIRQRAKAFYRVCIR